MRRLIELFNMIIKKNKRLKKWQRIVMAFAAMIVFATTYALILPAITVEKNAVDDVAGMYLETAAKPVTSQEGAPDEDALVPTEVLIAADQEDAVTYSYSDDNISATAIFSTDEEIPAGAELVVNFVDPESAEYPELSSRSLKLLNQEFINEITTCSFYDFALVCDNVDVTPTTGLADIQIIFRNNTVQHLEDTLYAGRFALNYADNSEAADDITANAPYEEDGLISMSAEGGQPEEESSVQTAAEELPSENNENNKIENNAAQDELISINADNTSVMELSDGIIMSLSLKGYDLSATDSLVGILAGFTDEEAKAAAEEIEITAADETSDTEEVTDAELPDGAADDTSAAPSIGTLQVSGEDYVVKLTYDETSGVPAGAELEVSEIAQDSEKYNTYLEKTKNALGLTEEDTLPQYAARFFDIKIMVNNQEFTPESGVTVEIAYTEPIATKPETEVSAVHFEEENVKPEVIEANTTEVKDDGTATVEFQADTFSVYGVIYTVDFHYEVNGKTYDYSIPGGGFTTISKIVELLGIVEKEEADVSEETKSFVANIANVEFSNPSLVWVGKVEESTTVAALKDANSLTVQYSGELTEEQISTINSSEVESGDWALISLQPFESEESLIVTMKNGDSFSIHMTDALVSNVQRETPYILYGVYEGQYYALRNDGACVEVEDNNLDALGDEFYWCSVSVGDDDIWRTYEPVKYNNYNYINLWEKDLSTAVKNWYKDIDLVSDPNNSGGYYFTTVHDWDNSIRTLWLYHDMDYDEWRFVSGEGNGNGSVTYIYKQEEHEFEVNVNDDSYGTVYINDTPPYVTSGQSPISSDGTNAYQIWARANDGYWFSHWLLDNQIVEESDYVQVFEEDGRDYSWIVQYGLTIGNEDGHTLTAVFVPKTSFNIAASPTNGGSVNISSSLRLKDGTNESEIIATAADGYWFDHWEVDGSTVSGDITNAEDGSTSTIPVGGINVGDGEVLTAVFVEKKTYDVNTADAEGGPATGCTVHVGDSVGASSVEDCALNRAGYNVESITAAAAPGYVFQEWQVDGVTVKGGATIHNAPDGSSSTIAAGTLKIGSDAGHVVTAVFAQEYTFTVTSYPNNGGTVQDDDKTPANTIHASLTKNNHNKYAITASPATDYKFNHWNLNGHPLTDDNGNYLYTDGIIPAGVLDLTSSDNLCAVFVQENYTITVVAGNNGKVGQNSSSSTDESYEQLTVSSNSDIKESVNTIYAYPNTGYDFAYWKVDPTNGVDSWGTDSSNNPCSATTKDIKPYVTGNVKLTAIFVKTGTRTFTVRVDEPGNGTVFGKDVTKNNVTLEAGVYSYVTSASNDQNTYSTEVRTVGPGKKFVGWKLYNSDGTPYASYEGNDITSNKLKSYQISANSIPINSENMILEACFEDRVISEDGYTDEDIDRLKNWGEGIAATDYNLDKSAEVFDYDNRIYRIQMDASSLKQAIDSSVVINFITDTSRSMYFPANLIDEGSYQNSGYNWDSDGQKLNKFLEAKRAEADDPNNPPVYFVINDKNGMATNIALYWDGSNWRYVDASYYADFSDDGLSRAGELVTDYQRKSSADGYTVYSAPERTSDAPWSRLDYLCMSVETAAELIYKICPNAQIDITTFNRSAEYKGTLPNNNAGIEAILRNIDVSGGTRQDLGLEQALPHFSSGSSKKQIAVLVTDGAPNKGKSGYTTEQLWERIGTFSDDMKGILDADGKNLELYTMGLSIANVGDNARKLAAVASEPATTYAKSVNSGKETSEAIQAIINSLLTNVSLFGSMTDTVDPAFYPVDINGRPITAGFYAADGSTLQAPPTDNTPYYEWTEESGVWTITWYNQTFAWAGVDDDGNPTSGWQESFYIKAKEDFLGGNKISTNKGDTNGMTATGYVKLDTSVTPFEQSTTKTFNYTPYVNVDELHMDGNETEWTVYLGTEVDPAAQLKNLLKEVSVKQVVKKDGTDDTGIYVTGAEQMFYEHDSSAVDNVDENAPEKGTSETLPLSYYDGFIDGNFETILREKIAELAGSSNHEKTVAADNIVYNEYGHAAGKFTVTVTKDVNAEAAADGAPNPHETKKTGDAVETYTLKVEYTPYTKEADTGEVFAADTYDHTTANGSAGQITDGTTKENDKVLSENIHVINVIAKGIEIVKIDKLTGEEIENNEARFKLYRALKSGETSQKTIEISEVDVRVIEVTETNLITGGAADANKFSSLPWYESSTGAYDGQYFLVEEDEPEGYLKLTKPIVISVITSSTYSDLSGKSISSTTDVPYNQEQTVTVSYRIGSADPKTSNETSGLFSIEVPNPPKGSLALRKQIQVTGEDAEIEDTNGLYKFRVYGPVGSDEKVTYFVTFKVVSGEMKEYWFKKYAGNVTDPDTPDPVSEKHGTVTDQDVGYMITDMATGIYAVQELQWVLYDNNIDPDDIYLKDIFIEPSDGGNTNDVVARKTSVFVVPDDPDAEQVLTATFLNEYATDICKFGVEKNWQDEDGSDLEQPWDSRISTIEFTVTQTSISGEERTLKIGGDEKVILQRYGRCAWVTPTVPGSNEYNAQWVNGGSDWNVLISGLEKEDPSGEPYTYKIKEICVRDADQNVVTGYETTYDLTADGGDLVEDNGKNVGIASITSGATAFINNRKITDASLNLRKIVEAGTDKPVNGNLTLIDGTYSFTVTGPQGAETPTTWYVNIIADSTDHGTNATPRYTTAYTYQIGTTEDERNAMAPAAVVDGGVPIQELTPGQYTITENGWDIGEVPRGSMMYLKDIDISDGSNNVIDTSQSTTTVYVGEGEVGSLEVAFTNYLKPYPGIKIEKIDESTRSEDEAIRYLEGAEFQILQWTGARYEVYPNETDSTVTTDNDGVAVFSGIEPGEYQIVETASPAGYVKLTANDIYIKVVYNESTGLHTITRYEEAYTGDGSVARTEVGESENLVAVTFEQASDDANPATFTVGNEPGAALPHTGGPGTKGIYLTGLILLALAGIGIWVKKQRLTA